ncbi:pitrilysin family protein [Nonomuraea sp. B10E15]|uniref:M16 family metallopeptidase n=1 Tax=Nonomuraea sp. B10E15 TaxID=3153560 RepID=UPI00325E4244
MKAITEAAHVERIVLPNGLRVVLDRHDRLGAAAITTVYGVGAAWDGPDQNGLAHLVEHLMFQGSANFGPLSHFNTVLGLGGRVNGQTHLDFTEYYQEIPAHSVRQILTMEADRMKGFTVSQDSFRTERDVVKEEVRTGQNHPFRHLPWRWLAPLLFDDMAAAYEPAGLLEDIDALTLRQAERFFAEHYTPANAILTLSGELDDHLPDTIERLFGEIPPGTEPTARPIEIDPNACGHHRLFEPSVPLPACAVARRAATRTGPDLDGAFQVLAAVLQLSANNRWRSSPAVDTRLQISLGMYGQESYCLSPPMLAAYGIGPGIHACRVAELLQQELENVAAGGVPDGTLETLRTHERIILHQALDSPLTRSRRLARAEFLHDDAATALAASDIQRSLTAGDLAEAATLLLSQPELSIELVNEGQH